MQRRHPRRQGVKREQPGLEHLAVVEVEAVNAADELCLVVRLDPVTETAAQLD